MDHGKGGQGGEGGGPRVCLRCGKIAASGDVFCVSCGSDLRSAPLPDRAGSAEAAAFRVARGGIGQVEEEGPPVSRPRLTEPPGTASVTCTQVTAGSREMRYAAAAGGATAQPPYHAQPGAWRFQPPRTDELAVASLVCAVASFVIPFLPALPAVILGVMARRRIAGRGGGAEGEGLAMAGIILGSLSLALFALILILAVAALLS